MNEKFDSGDFGIAKFKLKNGITGFNGYGTIIQVDDKYVYFKDNDDYQFLIEKSKFKFEKKIIKL